MRQIVLYIAMSLDGYLADPAGGVGWLAGDGSAPEAPGSYPRFYAGVDTIVLGWNTYHQVVTELSPGSWPYAGKTCYVVTHRTPAADPNVVFTDQDPAQLLEALKGSPGPGDVWLCGGASLVAQAAAADLIDTYWISVIPILLGAGQRLFGALPRPKALRLVETQCYNGITDLVYTRRERP